MKKSYNPWTSRFDGITDRESVRKRATVRATPLLGTLGMSREDAQLAVLNALKGIYVVNEQDLNLLVKCVGIAQAHCALAYPDIETFSRHLNSDEIQLLLPPPMCLTGLQGVGKSEFLKALRRVMPEDTTVELGSPYRTSFQLNAFRCAEVKAKATISQVMYPFLPPDCQPRKEVDRDGKVKFVEPKISLPEMVKQASRYGYLSGVCMNGLDELQFFTGSTIANTKVSQALMSARYVQVPLIYLANFSLCHRLMKRPPEERDRLLADIEVMLPEMPGSEFFLALLGEYQVALSEILDFKLVDEAEELHRMSVGIRRNLGRVICAAHLEMRKLGARKITMDHVKAGFKSKALAVMRADIADILGQAFSGKPVRGKNDLWCPFGVEFNQVKAAAVKAKEEKTAETVSKIMQSALTVEERRKLRLAKDAVKGGTSALRATRDPKPPKATVHSLHARNDRAFDAATLLANTEDHKQRGNGRSKSD